jgi:hypothetical protein
MCIKRNLLTVTLAVVILLLTAIPARPATEAEKQAAIDAGLAWLATQQNGNGSWTYSGLPEEDVAATGAVLLAFIEEGHTPTTGAYSTNVANGMDYLFANAQIVPITAQSAGNPDTNGNGLGVKFVLGGDNERDIYTTGLALLPIAAVRTGTVSVAGSQVNGWSYAQVIQDTADWLAYAQNDIEHDTARGGWRYFANQGSSDNSTSQWPTIALLYAQSAGATLPGWVATELAFWTVYIQNADGGSDYEELTGWSNVSRTGTLLCEQVFSGAGGGTDAALSYLNDQWLTTANDDWEGNFGHPYAMWAAYKGLELTIGLDDETTITNLHADPGDLDNPDHGWNWWEDYCEYLVNTQVGGTWPGYSMWTGPLATAWYINILAATEIPPPEIPVALDVKPTSCPNPLNVNSKGVLPVAIVGTEDLDVTHIDPATVQLMLVDPLRGAYEDVCTAYLPLVGKASQYDCTEEGPDGFMDMTLKFDNMAIAAALELIGGPLTDGEEILVTLKGNLLPEYGGTPIVGEDVVRIIKKGK